MEMDADSLEAALLERDLAVSALRDLHGRYEALLKAQNEVGECFVIAKGFRLHYASEAYCELSGYSLEELLAMPDLRVLIHESVREEILARMLDRDQAEPAADRYETLLCRKDGSTVEVDAVIQGSHAGPDALTFCIVREITEKRRVTERLRESETRYRLLFEHSSDAVVIADPAHGVVTANPAACEVFGYTLEEFRGVRRDQLVELSDPRFAEADRVREQDGQNRAELTLIRKDGTRFPAEVTSVRFLDQDGCPTSGMIIRDITERRLIERMKDQFIAVVSHELRTPLTAVKGALGLLSGNLLGDLSPQGERMLAIALSNTDRLMRLVNDILDVQRMATGHLSLAFAALDAACLLAQAAEAMWALADEAGVTLEIRSAPHRVWADEERILQALTNLLSNAIKFSPRGGVVTLSVTPEDEALRFSIEDQGRGIPPEMIEVIFERFRQVDASDSRQKGGTGLGLPISRGIIEQHGGRLWVESRLDAGTTFHFTLPLVPRGDAAS